MSVLRAGSLVQSGSQWSGSVRVRQSVRRSRSGSQSGRQAGRQGLLLGLANGAASNWSFHLPHTDTDSESVCCGIDARTQGAAPVQLYDPHLEQREVDAAEAWEVIQYGTLFSTVAKIKFAADQRVPASLPSFLETGEKAKAAPDPQRLAPHRIECSCTFKKSNPTGRPQSAYHAGHSPPVNNATYEKLQRLLRSNAGGNPNSKVEDIIAEAEQRAEALSSSSQSGTAPKPQAAQASSLLQTSEKQHIGRL